MRIMLIGGGSGGHITPLLAVANELKTELPNAELIAVCEQGSKFIELYESNADINRTYQISAGKYRRYAGTPLWKKIIDIKTILLNVRDIFRTFGGYLQARRLLKRERPNILLIKGGFVAVPVGLAASRLGIPFITHDSDSTPGLANKIISRWAIKHATGMPAELYPYPQDQTVFTGIPVSADFTKVDERKQDEYKKSIGLNDCQAVITVVGGSQGGKRLNDDIVQILKQLMESQERMGVVIIAGEKHQQDVSESIERTLSEDQARRVVVKGFVSDPAVYTGAADIVVSRASATVIAELSLQAKSIVLVPGVLAGAHQDKNADYLEQKQAAIQVKNGNRQELLEAILGLLNNESARHYLAANLHSLAKSNAAKELARLTIESASE